MTLNLILLDQFILKALEFLEPQALRKIPLNLKMDNKTQGLVKKRIITFEFYQKVLLKKEIDNKSQLQ